MSDTVNIVEVFSGLDARRNNALEVLSRFTSEQIAEASRIAHLYNKCDKTSLAHIEDIVNILTARK